MEKEINTVHNNHILERDMQIIIDFLTTIKFGSVTVIIQDGKILQIEKNEKIRMK